MCPSLPSLWNKHDCNSSTLTGQAAIPTEDSNQWPFNPLCSCKVQTKREINVCGFHLVVFFMITATKNKNTEYIYCKHLCQLHGLNETFTSWISGQTPPTGTQLVHLVSTTWNAAQLIDRLSHQWMSKTCVRTFVVANRICRCTIHNSTVHSKRINEVWEHCNAKWHILFQ